MFLTPSRSLNARIRALLGTRSFASSPDAIGPRGQGVPVLTRIRRMISSLPNAYRSPIRPRTTRDTAEGFRRSLVWFFIRARDDRVRLTFFSLRKKLVKHFSPPLGFYPESVWCCCCCVRACLSFGTHRSPERSLCLLAKQRTRSFDCVSRKAALFFVGLFLALRRSCACE